MQIKQAILDCEKQAVKRFLQTFNLKYLNDVDYTFYLEDENCVIGTVSLAKNVICDLAVSDKYQGENLATTLISHAISKLREDKIYDYKVFTKPEYLDKFLSLGFNLLIKTQDFVSLEGGESNVYRTIDNLKVKIKMDLGGLDNDYGAIVMNANPFTLGHLSLLEYALSKHNKVLIFILEEDKSEFSFKERFSLAFLATRQYADRVCVLPSTNYIISSETFPDYFIHEKTALTKAHAEYDAMIFEKYFMKELKISKRYIGSEIKDYMSLYNDSLKKILNDKVEIVDRFTLANTVVSASTVRDYIKSNNVEKALELVPTSTKAVLKMIIVGKQW